MSTVAELTTTLHRILQGRAGEVQALQRGGFMDTDEANARLDELTRVSASLGELIEEQTERVRRALGLAEGEQS